jgi:hypothetical protein
MDLNSQKKSKTKDLHVDWRKGRFQIPVF